MKKLLLLVLIAASLYAVDLKRMTGQDYRAWPELARLCYAAGYYSGYTNGRNAAAYQIQESLIAQGLKPNYLPLKKGEDMRDDLQRCLHTLTYGQAQAILDRYLADHPERWDKEIGDLAEEALTQACESRAKNP